MCVDTNYENCTWHKISENIVNVEFEKVFKDHKGKSVFLENRLCSYLIKYRREILDKIEIPKMESKADSIHYERIFNHEYWDLEDPEKRVVLFDDFPCATEVFEDKHGRNNMKIENKYLIKWKGKFN